MIGEIYIFLNVLLPMTTSLIFELLFSHWCTQGDAKELESGVWVGPWILTQWQCDLEQQISLCIQVFRL